MITIKYKNSLNTEYQQLNFEGRLIPHSNVEELVETDWNNKTYSVQNVIYNTYKSKIKVKESDYLSLLELKYCYKIYTLLDDLEFYEVEIYEIEEENIFGEFKNVTIYYKLLSSKSYYNILINQEVEDVFSIDKQDTSVVGVNVYLPIIKDVESNINVVDDFENTINDYSVLRKVEKIRLILEYDDYVDILEGLADFASIRTISTTYDSFYIERNTKISENLYLIDLKLIENTTVTTLL